MNRNMLRHKLLGILAKQFIIAEESNTEPLGVSFEKLYKELKLSDSELRILISELYENKEIEYFNDDKIIGLTLVPCGLTSFSNKKYIGNFWRQMMNPVKNSVSIAIPIFSFVISCIALYISIDIDKTKDNSELNTIKQRLELIEKHTNMQQLDSKISHQLDSLKIE